MLTRERDGQQTTVALAASGARDIEERLTQASFAIGHAWTARRVNPYIQADVAVLDYHDMPGELLPFANQDDRDRISSRIQTGLRLTITDHLALEVGAQQLLFLRDHTQLDDRFPTVEPDQIAHDAGCCESALQQIGGRVRADDADERATRTERRDVERDVRRAAGTFF